MTQSYVINDELAGLVPMALEAEQASLTEDIRINGLREPIILWHNKIVDGRCRQKACIAVGERIRVKHLDDELSEADVRIMVKSLNTRRNLTSTQKVMSASRQYNDETNTQPLTEVAKAWGISRVLLANANFILKTEPQMAIDLFNGKAVAIINSRGEATVSVKVSAVYAYLKKLSEASVEEEQGWHENTYITTQLGKEWYYSHLEPAMSISTKMLIAELANYKFTHAT